MNPQERLVIINGEIPEIPTISRQICIPFPKYSLLQGSLVKYRILKDDGTYVTKTLFRIMALRSFGNVLKGEIGGWVESESNLSHEGDCWISNNGKVYYNAVVSENAHVYNEAEVYDNAKIYGNAEVFGNAKVYGNASIYENAKILDNVKAYDNAKVYGDVVLFRDGVICNDNVLCLRKMNK
jgi:hypothetical protein